MSGRPDRSTPPRRRYIFLSLALLVLAGLGLVVWGSWEERPSLFGGPRPLPDPTLDTEEEIWRDGKVFPASAEVEQGVEYSFDLDHCGVDDFIDFDGSFWDPLALPPGNWVANSDQGTMTLLGPDRARYDSFKEGSVTFERHDGPRLQKEVSLCG